MQDTLVTLPLPILTFGLSIVAAVLVWRTNIGNGFARLLFTALFLTGALAALMVGLRFGYGITALGSVQRTLPFLAGPLMVSGFIALSRPDATARTTALIHVILLPALVITALLVTRAFALYDAAISLSYATYAGLMLWMWRKGPDHLTRARIELAGPLRRSMLWGAALLITLLVLDTAIALSFAWERQEMALTLISLGALLMIAALAVTIFAISQRPPDRQPAARQTTGKSDLVQKAEELLTTREFYRDTDLTVDRLSRRLGVPARALSQAINQAEGMNVSQYVNGFRLRHAARLLSEQRLPATKAMEQSGFLSRSNFYREFQRVYGMTPAAYRDHEAKG